jgi:hypothetical protein
MHSEQALRLEVGQLRRTDLRRRFPLSLSVGVLAGPRESLLVPDRCDMQLATDLALILFERARPGATAVWLTRPGTPAHHDEDACWVSASRAAAGILGRDQPPFYVVTRYGWTDPATGESRTWKRLRI